MKPKIVVFGAGAVGGYTGGHLARAGEDILLIDPWPDHIDCINRDGLHLSTPQDIRKGRRTEIDFINGLVAQKGREVGLLTPANEKITALIKRLERGEIRPLAENADKVLS